MKHLLSLIQQKSVNNCAGSNNILFDQTKLQGLCNVSEVGYACKKGGGDC